MTPTNAKQLQEFNWNYFSFGYVTYKYGKNNHEEDPKYELKYFSVMC